MLVVSDLQVQYCTVLYCIIDDKVYSIANDWSGFRASTLGRFVNAQQNQVARSLPTCPK